jgi:molybdate-binding protein
MGGTAKALNFVTLAREMVDIIISSREEESFDVLRFLAKIPIRVQKNMIPTTAPI